MIEKYGAEVYAFDPTPKSIDWVKKHVKSGNFHFYEYGISTSDGTQMFYLPQNKDFVSGSTIYRDSLLKNAIEVQMKRFETICRELGHYYIDVLKMDVEGTEFDVMAQIMELEDIGIGQICVEVHGRMYKDGSEKQRKLFKSLNDHGYRICAVGNNEVVTLVRE